MTALAMQSAMPALTPQEQALIVGDLSQLKPEQRADLVLKVCESVGLNPLTRPFEYITLNNKLTLYARKDATDQLRKIHNVSVQIASRGECEGAYIVTSRASLPSGREDESIGAVSIGGLKGDALCNAIMKAETKSKRRVTLSICGLGFLDESEIETIPHVRVVPDSEPAQIALPPAHVAPNGDVSPNISADDVIAIRTLFRNLAFTPERQATAVSKISDVRTTDLAALTSAEGRKLGTFLTRMMREAQAQTGHNAPCDACGATLEADGKTVEHKYDGKGVPCPNDVSDAANAARDSKAASDRLSELGLVPAEEQELAF